MFAAEQKDFNPHVVCENRNSLAMNNTGIFSEEHFHFHKLRIECPHFIMNFNDCVIDVKSKVIFKL